MHSTLNPEPPDPIARYFEQVALDEHLADDAARHPPAAVNNVQAPGDRHWFGRPAVRGFVGLLLAACIGVAAYDDAAKQIIAKWAPLLVQTSSPPPENPGLPAQPIPPGVQADAAMAAPSQPAPLAQTRQPEGVAPDAALSPESAQLLQTMARDLATVRQESEQLKASIEQLKTNQEQMTRDNARAAEQFKASQEQMARNIAEQNLRPKISAPPPRLTATPTRKPAPSPQARAQPQNNTAAAGRTAVAIRRRGCPCARTAALNLCLAQKRKPAGMTGALLFTQQKAVTAGRSGDGFSQVTKPHMAHMWPRSSATHTARLSSDSAGSCRQVFQSDRSGGTSRIF
jgi:hypothetical protein